MAVRLLRFCLAILYSMLPLSAALGQSVQELLAKAPEDANAVAVLRLHDLVESPLGIKEGWSKKAEQAYLNGDIPLPPWVDVFVRASAIRPGTPGGEWTSVLLNLPKDYDLKTLAEKEQTEVQQLDGHRIIHSKRHNGYFAEFTTPENSTRILGGLAPASRQEIARWLTTEQSSLSPYLYEAVTDSTPQLMMAADLRHLLDPVQIRYRLSGLSSLEDKPQARTALTLDFQSLQGIRLAVSVKETTTAEIRFDFGRQIGDEGQYVKDLFNEFLNDAGAALDELSNASSQTNGKSVILRMPLSNESLRRLLSLITTVSPSTPTDRALTSVAPPKPGIDSESKSAAVNPVERSLKYFQAVNDNVADMERAYKRIKNYRQTAAWHDTYARRIDELPIAGVDPELLDYGQKMSSLLRALGASLRGMGLKIDALNNQITYEVEQTPVYRNGAEWWWGGAWTAYGPYTYGQPMKSEVHTNLQEVRARQMEIVNNTQPEREQIWQMISEERNVTRRKMVAKYGSDFQKE